MFRRQMTPDRSNDLAWLKSVEPAMNGMADGESFALRARMIDRVAFVVLERMRRGWGSGRRRRWASPAE